MDEISLLTLQAAKKYTDEHGGGGGGTTNYNDLSNQPQIGGVTLIGNKTASDLGLASKDDVTGKQDVLTAGDYIDITNNKISVNRNIVPENTTYNIKHVSRYNAVVTKYRNGVKQSENNYQYWGGTVWTIDDAFKLVCDRDTGGGGFAYQLLADTIDHTAGYYGFLFDLNETSVGVEVDLVFPDEDKSGQKLVIKSEMDTALALKQDTTDNSLQTTDKTVVGGINELKSGLTTLDNEVNGDATTYPYADVITIEDAVPSNLADCNVKIEPVQDLHGYDHPWVGGAGKNKFDGVSTISANINSSGVISNESINNSVIYAPCKANTTYTVSKIAGSVFRVAYCSSIPTFGTKCSGLITDNTASSITITTGDTVGYIVAWVWNSADTTDVSNMIASVQVEEGSTATTWEPYSNICPISGHTEVDVQRDGKNLFDKNNAGNLNGRALNPETGLPYVTSGWTTSSYIKIEPSTTYTLTTTSNSSSVAFYDSEKVYISGATSFGTKTTPSNAKYLRFDYKTENSGIIQLELGSTATTYEPYAGKTYTIALGSTIYGGTVDFDRGVMTVDRAIAVYDGSNDESWLLDDSGEHYFFSIELTGRDATKALIANNCENVAIAKVNTNLGVGSDARYLRYRYANDNSLTVSDLKTYLSSNNLQVCYELATPTTIQLTPQQIQLLKGTNTLTASTGQISVTVNGVSGSIGAIESGKQDKIDYALETTAKTVVDGINELKNRVKVIEVTTSDTVDQGTTVKVPTGYDAAGAVIVGYTAQRTNNLWYNSDDHVDVGMYSEYLYVVPKNADVLERTVKVVMIKFGEY